MEAAQYPNHLLERTEFYSNIFDPKADSDATDEELRNKKNRYVGFDAALELPRIANHVFRCAPDSFRVLGETTNAIDHVIFEMIVKGKPYIVRINRDAAPELYLLAEDLIYKQLKKEGILNFSTCITHLRDDKFNYDFTVMDRIGHSDVERHLKPEERETEKDYSIARKTGQFLARFHKIKTQGFGHFSLIDAKEGRLAGANRNWKDYIRAKFDENIAFLRAHNLIDGSLAEEKAAALARNSHLFDSLEGGVLLHGDYHDANMLLDAEARMVGAVDLSQAKSGDPVFDIAFYSTYYSEKRLSEFLKGYFEESGPIPDFEKKMLLYRMRINLGKAKLRKRFGYEARIPKAIDSIKVDLEKLKAIEAKELKEAKQTHSLGSPGRPGETKKEEQEEA